MEKLTALLPHFLEARDVNTIVLLLQVVAAVAGMSVVPTPARREALTNLLRYMLEVEKQKPVRSKSLKLTYDDVYFTALSGSVSALYAGVSVGAVTAPKLQYSAVAALVPLLRRIIWLHSSPHKLYEPIRLAVYAALLSALQPDSCDSDSGSESGGAGADDAKRRRDIADFAASGDFEPLLLQLGDAKVAQQLQRFLALFDESAFAGALSNERIGRLLAYVDAKSTFNLAEQTVFMGLLASMTAHSVEFAQRLASARGFARILDNINSAFGDRSPPHFAVLSHHTMTVFDNSLRLAPDAARATQQLLSAGAVDTCCTLLMHFLQPSREHKKAVLAGARPGADTTAGLLRVLRAMISAGGSNTNPCATRFLACYGLQALELLQKEAAVPEGDDGPVLRELAQLRGMLVRMALIAPDTA